MFGSERGVIFRKSVRTNMEEDVTKCVRYNADGQDSYSVDYACEAINRYKTLEKSLGQDVKSVRPPKPIY